MAVPRSLNRNNSAVKRIMQEARELANDPSTDYSAAPLEDDIFEWHCTIRGPKDTDFEGGLYHFRIVLPAEYPFRPPSIMMLTPSGRFELNTKICISFTNYHEELWQPAWGVRTAIVGLQGFFPLRGTDAVGVGSLETPSSERKRLAALSRDWCCPRCGKSNVESLPDPPEHSGGHTLGEAPKGEAPKATESSPAPARTQSEPSAQVRAAPTTESASSPPPPPQPLPVPQPPPRPAVTAMANTTNMQRPTLVPPSARPPLLLDVAIGVFIVLILALVAKRVL
ncbi:ubiquitin-conjugating enzyme/RWD-like protein [Vararia minispora EC-137]|uniref:Ubiquitin-conjugating enzyme/RWD-like protein n=1 Tax=Vararia minispora EC-137 TaxID=1314806 RepID=A0ACB8QDL4_9AGAM|nr:ubiquitin-conjugating enzyme/RWD-like protein [Vararia minispora EC-137]